MWSLLCISHPLRQRLTETSDHGFDVLQVVLLFVHQQFDLMPFKQCSCAGLEFKASLEKSLNFGKLEKFLNCFGLRVEDLEKFGICLS